MEGICVDLWRQVAEELNLSYIMKEARDWPEMLKTFKSDQADVILQRMDDGMMTTNGISE